jgi:hypothetical protein
VTDQTEHDNANSRSQQSRKSYVKKRSQLAIAEQITIADKKRSAE